MSEKSVKTVCVAMSGGVDSSVAAHILKQQGYNVFGVFMKLWEGESKERGCCSLSDANDALRVCQKIGVPFYVLNLKEEFKDRVINRFVDEYISGRTPNPCIYCNTELKFHILFNKARTFGADYIATGHYARIEIIDDTFKLLKGIDEAKDQSYFLFGIPPSMLQNILFPLGNIEKKMVRKIAEEQGLITAKKRESQEICFVNNDYRKFLQDVGVIKKVGKIVDKNGNVLGTHDGYFNFTIGQRSGLKLAIGKPVYVTKILSDDNIVEVGDEADLYRKDFVIGNCNFFEDVGKNDRFFIKVRYRHKGEYGRIINKKNNEVHIAFDTPQRGITPGQAAVMYKGDVVIGGGWIKLID